MKRVIKFRCYDTLLKQMVPNVHAFHFMGEVMAFGILEEYLFKNLEGKTSIERWGDIEVMQFSGLQDKNGVDIYEGDVVKIIKSTTGGPMGKRKEFKAVVVWGAPSFELQDTEDTYPYEVSFGGISNSEVIGNIFEYPNLLTHVK